MSVTYRVDADRNMVWVRGADEVRMEDFVGLRANLRADETARELPLVLVDLRQVTIFDLTPKQLTSFASDRSALLEPGSKIAIVAPPGEGFGLSRMYQLSRGETPERIRVFSDLEGAEQWLHATPED